MRVASVAAYATERKHTGRRGATAAREVAAWRHHLIDAGPAPATVVQRLTVVRRLDAHAGHDDAIQRVKATSVQELPSPG